jgi:hypothetical protein
VCEKEDSVDDDETMDKPEESLSDGLTLLDLMHAGVVTPDDDDTIDDNDPRHPQRSLQRIAKVLTRLEDLSHILVWTTTKITATNPIMLFNGVCQISVIELPRLKVKFQPQVDTNSGIVRLQVLDQAGWFVSDAVTSDDDDTTTCDDNPIMGVNFLRPLLTAIPHCLVLENSTGELQIMVANHDVHRPKVEGAPFSTDLVFDRSSLAWSEVMETRYYLYPVHTTRTFLLTPTLGAAFYLTLLYLMHGEYEYASQLVDTCTVDVSLTREEKWIFDQVNVCSCSCSCSC